jgi:hypothetical protein
VERRKAKEDKRQLVNGSNDYTSVGLPWAFTTCQIFC